MKENELLWPVLVAAAAIVLIVFLMIKNKRDKKKLHSSVRDQMKETKEIQSKGRNRI